MSFIGPVAVGDRFTWQPDGSTVEVTSILMDGDGRHVVESVDVKEGVRNGNGYADTMSWFRKNARAVE